MTFLIESDKYTAMKNTLIEISKYIKQEISEKTPVIIKHHNDCDGFISGLALEKAIIPLIRKNVHLSHKNYRRIPTRTPFYDYGDAIRDIETINKFYKSAPLIIILDHGSTKESILSFTKLKEYGVNIIVIDHHNPSKYKNGKNEVEDYVDLFLNPHNFGFGSEIVTGMLACEIAKFIETEVTIPKYFPALAGVADKSKCEEFDKYLELSGFDKSYLEKWAMCIDFEATYSRNYDSKIMKDIFEYNEKTKRNIEIIFLEIQKRFKQIEPALKKYSESKDINEICYTKVFLDKSVNKSLFPSASKITSYLHKKKKSPKITLGILSNQISFRLEGVSNITLHSIIDVLKNRLPYATIDGGGHIFAGTIRFSPGAKEEILKIIESTIRKSI